ncbi:hypothetical protein ACW9HQ_42235, partial [Nocardia gipuzkoensis]
RTRPGVEVDADGTVSISLQPILAAVQRQLLARGFTVADRIPDVDLHIVLFRATELPRLRNAVRALDRAGTALPVLAMAAAVGAIGVAPRGRRMRVTALIGTSGAAAMVLCGTALAIGRGMYLDSVPPEALSPDAAAALFDTVTTPLRTGFRAVGALGVLIGVGGYLFGSSPSARAVRAGWDSALTTLWRRRYRRAPSRIERWTARYRTPLRFAICAAAVLALLLWPYPTVLVVAGIALVTL